MSTGLTAIGKASPIVSRVRVVAALGLTFAPVLLTSGAFWVLYVASVDGPLPGPLAEGPQLPFLLYAIFDWLALAAIVRLVGWRTLAAAGLRVRLSLLRIAFAALGFATGIGIFAGVDVVLRHLGLPPVGGMQFRLSGAAPVAMLAATAVASASFCEEVFFRVLWFGYLRRFVPPMWAALAATLAFALVHLPYFGIGGLVFIAIWSLIPLALFAYFGDLGASWLMHLANNTYAYILVPWLGG